MTLRDILLMVDPISELIGQKLPFQTAYKLTQIVKVVEDNQTFYQKKIQEIFEELSEPDSEGEPYIPIDKNSEFDRQSRELRDIEIDIKMPTLTYKELEGAVLTAKEVYALRHILTE